MLHDNVKKKCPFKCKLCSYRSPTDYSLKLVTLIYSRVYKLYSNTI